MKTIQSRYYFPNNAALVVTGDVKPDEVFRQAEQIMGSWEKRAVDPFKEFPLVEHPPLAKSEAVVIEKNTGEAEQNTDQNVFINIGWQGPSIGKDDKATYAADVFSYILQQPDSRFPAKPCGQRPCVVCLDKLLHPAKRRANHSVSCYDAGKSESRIEGRLLQRSRSSLRRDILRMKSLRIRKRS
jgi:hypothetical protein